MVGFHLFFYYMKKKKSHLHIFNICIVYHCLLRKLKKKSIALHSIYQVLDVIYIKIDSNLNSATITAQSCLKLE